LFYHSILLLLRQVEAVALRPIGPTVPTLGGYVFKPIHAETDSTIFSFCETLRAFNFDTPFRRKLIPDVINFRFTSAKWTRQ
jgi:hypothetical protein